MDLWGRARRLRAHGEEGQTLLETAIAFPVLLLVALALVQFALYYHAESVVTGATQDGARVAAAEDSGIAAGVAHTQALLQAGLGRSATGVAVQGVDGGDTVEIETQGSLKLIIPWVGGGSLPLRARSVMSKERFRVGAGG